MIVPGDASELAGPSIACLMSKVPLSSCVLHSGRGLNALTLRSSTVAELCQSTYVSSACIFSA